MKNIISVLLSIILLQSCGAQSGSDSSIDLIKQVETGLTRPVYITGDSTWSIAERMEHYGIPGMSIAVIHQGKIVWTKGYGVMDKESKTPVTRHTLFQASTLSIPVSAYGALRFVEEGKVTLDENINRYLKSWQVPDNEFTKEKKATVRNLLNHSAGINLHATPGYPLDATSPTLVEVFNGTSPAKNEPIAIIKEPDESYYISYTGYGIVQLMMTDIEGKEYPEIMRDLVLQPLGMTNSTFDPSLSQEQGKKAATAYLQDGTMVPGKRYVHPVLASRGLWTTAEDLAKFIIHVQQTLKGNRDQGLSKEMTELMVTPHSVSSYGPGSEYGLGFQIINRKEETYLRHWGWNRGFYAEFLAHKDKDYGVVVMTNTTFPAFNAEVIRAVARAYEWDNFIPEHTKLPIDQPLANEVIGRYQANIAIIEVFQENDQLFFKDILDVNAQELVRVSENHFARRNTSRLVRFVRNDENEIVNLVSADRYDESIATNLVKLEDSQKSPVEFLLEDDFENALQAYSRLKEEDPDHPALTEDYLNDLGYRFYHEDRMALSQNTFKVNTKLYPDSYQVYASYAEACDKAGNTDLAIQNYSKSLELNPQNGKARERLKELENGEM